MLSWLHCIYSNYKELLAFQVKAGSYSSGTIFFLSFLSILDANSSKSQLSIFGIGCVIYTALTFLEATQKMEWAINFAHQTHVYNRLRLNRNHVFSVCIANRCIQPHLNSLDVVLMRCEWPCRYKYILENSHCNLATCAFWVVKRWSTQEIVVSWVYRGILRSSF